MKTLFKPNMNDIILHYITLFIIFIKILYYHYNIIMLLRIIYFYLIFIIIEQIYQFYQFNQSFLYESAFYDYY